MSFLMTAVTSESACLLLKTTTQWLTDEGIAH